MLDKDTVNRILHLHKVQGLEPKVIGQRFGFSTSRVYNIIRRQASSTKRALKKPQLNDMGYYVKERS